MSTPAPLHIYVTNLLKSGSADVINLARDFFDKSVSEKVDIHTDENSLTRLIRRVSSVYSTSFALYLHQIPHVKSLQMVLDAAQNYFDSASSYSDPDIDLAKVCLNLMQDLKEPLIAQMFDLIDAVKILNKDFRMEILPLTVRLSRDKIGLVKTAMSNLVNGYKKIQQLLKLTLFLHPDGLSFEEAESLILNMAGSAAMDNLDMKFCAQVCQNIVAKGYQTGWQIFVQLAKDQSEPPVLDQESKLASINYALNMCPNNEIFNVLNAKCLIEMRSLQNRVQELSPDETAGGIGESFIEEQERTQEEARSTTPISLNPLKLHEFVSATSKLINITPVKGVANAVKSGGDMLFQGAKTLLKTSTRTYTKQPDSTTGWEDEVVDEEQTCSGWDDDDLEELLNTHEKENNEKIILSKESYPMPYLNEREYGSPFFNTSNFFFKYDSFSDSAADLYIRSHPSLELCFILDKLWHLQRIVLGEKDSGERNGAVVKQLVLEVLPEDIPLGLAILFSVKDISTLDSIFAEFPTTPLGMAVALYSLAVLIHQPFTDPETVSRKNPNRVSWQLMLIAETGSLIEENKIVTGDQRSKDLIRLFQQYNLKLADAFG